VGVAMEAGLYFYFVLVMTDWENEVAKVSIESLRISASRIVARSRLLVTLTFAKTNSLQIPTWTLLAKRGMW
jgi:hypothetical protein